MEEQPVKMTPRQRAWLWILGSLLCAAPLMGLMFKLSRVSETPLIIVFAPAVLLGVNLGAETPLAGAYYLMPVQCIIYGLLLAQAELSGRRSGMLIGLAIAHTVIAMRAMAVTGGTIPG